MRKKWKLERLAWWNILPNNLAALEDLGHNGGKKIPSEYTNLLVLHLHQMKQEGMQQQERQINFLSFRLFYLGFLFLFHFRCCLLGSQSGKISVHSYDFRLQKFKQKTDIILSFSRLYLDLWLNFARSVMTLVGPNYLIIN